MVGQTTASPVARMLRRASLTGGRALPYSRAAVRAGVRSSDQGERSGFVVRTTLPISRLGRVACPRCVAQKDHLIRVAQKDHLILSQYHYRSQGWEGWLAPAVLPKNHFCIV